MEHPKTLYLIDDDTDDLDFFCEAAANVDPSITCLTSSDSLSSLNAFKNYDVPVPDLIFLDLNMPVVDGRKFLVELKKLKYYAQVPVIIYTTSSHSRDREETKSLGAAGFLTKPCSLHELTRELSSIFARYSFADIGK
jgi:CheY-like chemotaxis protein